MSVLIYSIDSNNLVDFTLENISSFFTSSVIKRLSISTTDALINPSIVNPENAYTYEDQ